MNNINFIKFTRGRNYNGHPNGEIEKTSEISIEKLQKWLENPTISNEKAGKWWYNFMIPEEANGKRNKANCKAMSAAMIDLDEVDLSFEQIKDILEERFPYCFFIYTTFNHKVKSNEKGARLRLIVPFKEDIKAEDYKTCCTYILNKSLCQQEWLEGVDSTMFSVEHASYFPACRDKENYICYRSKNDSLFDFYALSDDEKAVAKKYETANNNALQPSNSNIVTYINTTFQPLDALPLFFSEYYEKDGDRVRFRNSNSQSGVVELQEGNRIFSHHKSDIINQEKFGGQKARTLFQYFYCLRGDGDIHKTMKYLKDNNDRLKIPHYLFTGSYAYTETEYCATATQSGEYQYKFLKQYKLSEQKEKKEYIYFPFLPVSKRFSLILGESGVGKTSFYTKLIASFLKGEAFLGQEFNNNYKDKCVVVVLTEGDAQEIAEILRKNEIDIEQIEKEERLYVLGWGLAKYDSLYKEFIQKINEIGIDNIGLLIWDSWLGTNTTKSKNDSESVTEGTKAIKYVLEGSQKGCAAYLIHHFNKNSAMDEKNRSNGSMYIDGSGGLTLSLSVEKDGARLLKLVNENLHLDRETRENWTRGLKLFIPDDDKGYQTGGFLQKTKSIKEQISPFMAKFEELTKEELKIEFDQFAKQYPTQTSSPTYFLSYLLKKDGLSFGYDELRNSLNRNFADIVTKIKDFLTQQQQ